MKTSIILALSGFFLLSACGKEGDPVFDQLGPEVTILTPVDGAELPGGEKVPLVAEIEENLGLHSYYTSLQ